MAGRFLHLCPEPAHVYLLWWTIHWVARQASHGRSSRELRHWNRSSPPTQQCVSSRQLPPARTTLRVTLEVMFVLSRRFHTKAHLSHNWRARPPFCQATGHKAPSSPQTKHELKGQGGAKYCLLPRFSSGWLPWATVSSQTRADMLLNDFKAPSESGCLPWLLVKHLSPRAW